MQKQCLVCGNTFDKKSSESKKYWASKKYCSYKCSLTKTGIKEQGVPPPRGLTPWNKGRKNNEEEKLRMNLSGLEKGRGLFKGQKKPEWSGENHPTWKPSLFLPCEYCGKTVERKQWQLRKHVYCNLVCSRAGIRGKMSPVYKGENAKNSLRQRIMQLPEYVTWRKAVFTRDSFRCVLCGKTSGFEADHIVPYKDIRDRHNMRTTEDALACAELWNTSNGRTLCRECHRKTDNYPKNLLKKQA